MCVAAALAAPQHLGPKIIAGAASCNNPEGITSLAGIPSLDYNVSALLPMSSPSIGVPDRKLLTGSGRCTQASLASARGRRAAARSRARTSSTSSTVRSTRSAPDAGPGEFHSGCELRARGLTACCSTADAVVSMGWDRVSAWTKTGEEIPYMNLNDFLHYA